MNDNEREMSEKRKALDEFCNKYKMCFEGCPLAGDVCQCGCGKYFTRAPGTDAYMTDDEINAAYAIAYPDDGPHIKDSGKGRCDMNGNEISIRAAVLDEAKAIVTQDRCEQYGGPEDSFRVIGELWAAYLRGRGVLKPGEEIDPDMVANMMVLLKVARASTAIEPKRDNYIDMAGYAACAAELEERK